MKYFTGRIEHSLDEKNRIRIPKKYRQEFPENEKIYFVRYTKGCIAVFSESALAKRLEVLEEIKSNQPELQLAKRVILSAIEEIEEDKQGRTVLSAVMRKHAGITKDVVTIGMGDYLEVWAAEKLTSETESISLDEALLRIAF